MRPSRTLRIFRWFYVAGLIFTLAATGREMRAADGFESANILYDEGKYAEAAAGYDQLIAEGKVSAALYFNRGNALFKEGQIGRAIASYRQAQLLAPRD